MNDALADLHEDFAELRELCQGSLEAAQGHARRVEHKQYSFTPDEYTYMQSQVAHLVHQYEVLMQECGECLQTNGEVNIAKLLSRKREVQMKLRMLQSTLGAVVAMGYWQSPSFESSGLSQVGVEDGLIRASDNDYKRDFHAAEAAYASRFVAAYVDHPVRLAPIGLPTSSGMAAITTVLTCLAPNVAREDVVLLGRSTYFQTKWLCEQLFKTQVRYVDESDVSAVVELAKELQPKILFFESIGNTQTVSMPHLSRLIPALSRVLTSRSTFILDNTTTAVAYQPLQDLPHTLVGMELVVVESLLKYHQFGLDRVNGGIIWAPFGLLVPKLRTARMHTGTVLPDVSVHMLPVPNRVVLDKRLARIQRNTLLLATRLDTVCKRLGGPVSQVVYPGLPSHPAYEWAEERVFHGGFFVLKFKEHRQTFAQYDSFVAKVLKEAKKRDVALVGGTSFGFNTTRLYIPARAAGIQDAFVRVSVGTETVDEIEKLGDAFEAALR